MYIVTKASTAREMRALERIEKPIRKVCNLDSLRIVAFSDYRVQDISLLLDFITSLQPAPHLIIYAGDDIKRFHNGEVNLFEKLAAKATYGLCAVVGNDCGTDSD